MKELTEHLAKFMTPVRKEKFERVLENRTRYITVVLEDIFQPFNASAALRTCDCFGIQDVHIIENQNEYTVNPYVTLGATKWLSLNRYNQTEHNTENAIKALKTDGYRIVATTPNINSTMLYDFDLSKGKTAVLFGTEASGLSDVALHNADEFLQIPMYGLTGSYNISASVAMILYALSTQLRHSTINWQLTPQEAAEIHLKWLKESVDRSEVIERDFYKRTTMEGYRLRD